MFESIQAIVRAENPVDTRVVQQLIVDLDSEHRRTRIEAESQLLMLKPAPLPQIKEALGTANIGVRESLQRVQQVLEIQAAEQSLRGSKISLSASTLQNALSELTKQSGTQVHVGPDQGPIAPGPAINVQEVLFWSALERVCRDYRVGWKWNSQLGIFVQADVAPLPGSDAVSGCFRINATLAPSKAGSIDTMRRTSRVNLRIDTEAIVKPLYVIVRDADFTLINQADSSGSFTPDAKRELNFDHQTAEFSVDFLQQSDSQSSPIKLKGLVHIRCAALNEELVFPLQDARHSSQFAGRTEVKLLSSEELGGGMNVVLRVTYPPGVKWESHRVGMLHRNAWLRSSSGGKISFDSLDVQNEATRSHEVHYQFPTGPSRADLKMIYVAPALYATVPVPFEIELPVQMD